MLKTRRGTVRLTTACASFLLVCLAGSLPVAAFDVIWDGGTGDWNSPGNWDIDDVPDVSFEDVAIINNGGTATLNTAALNQAGGLTLGQALGESGTLHIQSGGSLELVGGTGAAEGIATIGLGATGGGTGIIKVDGGGSFSTTLVDLDPGSSLEIGDGAGVASVASTDGMWLAGRTVTHGAGHTFTAANFVTFQAGAQYVVDLTSSSHTTLTAGGLISGTAPIVIQTSGGYTPSLGATWTILDGAQISDGLEVDLSETTAPPVGLQYSTRIVDSGGRQQLELNYDAVATLTVDTDTGAVSIVSQSGAAIEMVGYTVQSAAGLLSPANWSSLTSQSTPGWEQAGVPSMNALSELNPENSLTLNASPVGLGTSVYEAPTEFGVDPDLTFRYAVDGELVSTEGVVEFAGSKAANNLLLTVDPSTGEGQLQNSSAFTIDILGYSITSDSGSLDDTNWMSLTSQSTVGWVEAASDEFGLNELVPEDPGTTLTPETAYSLGDMFLVGGAQDLELSFAVSIDGGDPTVMQGAVLYGEIVAPPEGLPGDYNEDNVVDAADYAMWRNNLGPGSLPNEGPGVSPGVTDNDDYLYWRTRYGATSNSVAGAGPGAGPAAPVPEPFSLAMMGLSALALTVVRQRSGSVR